MEYTYTFPNTFFATACTSLVLMFVYRRYGPTVVKLIRWDSVRRYFILYFVKYSPCKKQVTYKNSSLYFSLYRIRFMKIHFWEN